MSTLFPSILPEADDDQAGVCGAEQIDGSRCERPADECQYHGDA